MIELHNVIKQIRQDLNMSQMAFAEKMHVSFSTVNRWENGHTKPNHLATVTMIELCHKESVNQNLTSALLAYSNVERD